MSSNFDWRAEDDISWDRYAAPGPDDEQPSPRKKRPLWLIVLVVAVVVLSAGYIAFRQLRRYVDNTAASVEEDVLSSHALVKMAATEGDLELFAPLLSGRDPNWAQDQISVLDMDLLFNREPFGLHWRPEETGNDVNVSLSNNLQSAEVEYTESYGYGLNGEEGAIQLTQTAVYRLSETRWLLSPPDDEFWGNYITAKGSFIILTFPERDDEIGSRLASDLESTLAGACRSLELNCDENWPVDVLLATDLDAVMDTNNPEHFAGDEEQLVLPTPTLIGKPANNASYRALYQGYATFIVSRLIARQAGWECCEESPFFKALLDVQLHQLGIQTWPLTAADYRLALREPLDIDMLRTIQNEAPSLAEVQERPDWQTIHLFVEFLVNRPEAPTIIELEEDIARTDSFASWIAQAGVTGSLDLIENEWEEAVHQRILAKQSAPPLAWPEEDLALICNDGQARIANIYRYDPAQNSWTVEIADRDFVVMHGLPNNEGLILTEQYLDVDQLRTTLWREDQETTVTFGEIFFYSADVADPSGRYLVANGFQEDVETGDFVTTLFLLDLEDCNNENCSLLEIDAMPVWSPDGSQTLYSVPDFPDTIEGTSLIFLGDELVQNGEQIGTGNFPFWLDNENYAFLTDGQDKNLVMASINDIAAPNLLSRVDLAHFIPELEDIYLEILTATADPTAPDLIYITAANRLENKDYLFTYDWHTEVINLVLTTENSPGGLFVNRFSPNHNYLVLQTNVGFSSSSSQRQQDIYLHDIQSQTSQSYTLARDTILPERSWSNNGEWLAILEDGYFILSAPKANYDHLVPYDFRDCTSLAWIK